MKFLLYILILIALISCVKNKPQHKFLFTHNNLIGEWFGKNKNYDRYSIYFLEDSSYHSFSWENGGYYQDNGFVFDKDSIKGKYFWKYKYTPIDSNKIVIIDDNNDSLFLRKEVNSDYINNFKTDLKKDSIRNKLIGWWYMTDKNINYIELFNSPEKCEYYTVNFRYNGSCDLYLNNNLDSSIYYSFQIEKDGFMLQKGCISTYVEISIKDSILNWYQGRSYPTDTLKFKRLTKIKP